MSDQSQGPGWWIASDGKWYPPQSPTMPPPVTSASPPPTGPPYVQPPSPSPSGASSPVALIVAIAAVVVLLVAGGVAFALTRPKNDLAAPPVVTPPTLAPASSTSTTKKESIGGATSTTSKGRATTTARSSDGEADFPPPKDAAKAIRNAGLPELTEEGSFVHYHTHLDVIVNGSPVTVPEQIGITRSTISPMHTHDDSGVIHLEADEDAEFTTKQFFTEWDITLDKDCVGDFCADGDHHLLGFVNGEPVDDPSTIVFGRHDEVVIWYGSTPDPADIPSSYDFPAGL